MRGEDFGSRAKPGHEAPSGNLVDDILSGRFEQQHNEGDDLLGEDPIDDLEDLEHLK